MQIQVTQQTILKPGSAPPRELPPGDLVPVGGGSSFSLKAYRQVDDQVEVTFDPSLTNLANLHPSGRSVWWLPASHIKDLEGMSANNLPTDTPAPIVPIPNDRGFKFTLPGQQGIFYSNDPAHPSTPNITWRELLHFEEDGTFRRPETAEVVLHLWNLAKFLQEIRNRFDRPLMIVSGYRTPEVNEAIGGASHSRHLIGDAADIRIQGVRAAEVYAELDGWWGDRGGLGFDLNFTHIDRRGWRARWAYPPRR
jgi:hypothetical protein